MAPRSLAFIGFLALLFNSTVSSAANCQQVRRNSQQINEDWPLDTSLGIPFRIAYSSSEDKVASEGHRFLYLLLSTHDFKLNNVIKLIGALSQKHNHPRLLYITVYDDEAMLKRAIAALTVTIDSQKPNEQFMRMMDEVYPARTGYLRARYIRSEKGKQTLLFSPDADSDDNLRIELPDSGPYTGQADADIGIAAATGDVGTIRALVSKGLSVNAKDTNGRTALGRAALAGERATLETLLGLGADCNLNDNSGFTPLLLAALRSDGAIVELLLARGSQVNAAEKSGRTALMFSTDNSEICKLLLRYGADVDIKDNDGQTALMIAAKRGKLETTRILVTKGADLNLRNKKGETALVIARTHNRKELVEYLERAGAR